MPFSQHTIKKTILLLLLILSFHSLSANEVLLQTPDSYFVVLYIESREPQKVIELKEELETYTNKIISVDYNQSTSELTIVFNELIRNDTIYQIVLKYVDDFKETETNYPGKN